MDGTGCMNMGDTQLLERMLKCVELINTFRHSPTEQNAEHENINTLNNTATNDTSNDMPSDISKRVCETTEFTRALGCASYFAHPDYRRDLEVFTKLLEIRDIINFYESRTQDCQTTEAGNEGGDWKRLMINAAKVHASPEKQSKLNMLERFLEMRDIAAMLREMDIWQT